MNTRKESAIRTLCKLQWELTGNSAITTALTFAIEYLRGDISPKQTIKKWQLLICDMEEDERGDYTMKISPCFIQDFHKALIRGTPDSTLVYFNYTKKPPPKQKGGIYKWLLDNSEAFRNWHTRRVIKRLGISIGR